jgi:N-acetylglucosamine-6-phosphate deacetylase
VTHLYNAMSGLTGRDPGVIGAVLNNPSCYVAIIPDLFHVHPANISIAAKLKPDHLFFVTDCHAPVGSDIKEFNLTGRHMYVKDGRCVDKNGNLCGSFILMNQALKNAVNSCRISLELALKMSTLTPAKALKIDNITGKL